MGEGILMLGNKVYHIMLAILQRWSGCGSEGKSRQVLAHILLWAKKKNEGGFQLLLFMAPLLHGACRVCFFRFAWLLFLVALDSSCFILRYPPWKSPG